MYECKEQSLDNLIDFFFYFSYQLKGCRHLHFIMFCYMALLKEPFVSQLFYSVV